MGPLADIAHYLGNLHRSQHFNHDTARDLPPKTPYLVPEVRNSFLYQSLVESHIVSSTNTALNWLVIYTTFTGVYHRRYLLCELMIQ